MKDIYELEERATEAYDSFMFWDELAEAVCVAMLSSTIPCMEKLNELHSFYMKRIKREKEIYEKCLDEVENENKI